MKTRWIKEVPIKINVHAWKVSVDGLPTRFNLSRRGVYMVGIGFQGVTLLRRMVGVVAFFSIAFKSQKGVRRFMLYCVVDNLE
nr:RNA-directed DNA polymerase, eukaryota [Tanacetum cinerariifolium]